MGEQVNLTMLERMERALVLLAYFIELDGDVHLPMFEKFEAELAELKQAELRRSRARRLLNHYNREGGVNAMVSNTLSLSSSGGASGEASFGAPEALRFGQVPP